MRNRLRDIVIYTAAFSLVSPFVLKCQRRHILSLDSGATDAVKGAASSLPTLSATKQIPGNNDDVLIEIEKQVLASARAKLDTNRLLQALDNTHGRDEFASTFTSNKVSSFSEPWKISLSASLLCSSVVFYFSNANLILTGIASFLVFVMANSDPVNDDSLQGALARVLGRVTIRSVEASQPTVKAVARAVVTGQDELQVLQLRLSRLEEENAELRKWKAQRINAEANLGLYTLSELKNLARQHDIPVGGTKMQIILRLLEAGLIAL